jgi:hypothetical protein
MKTTEVTVIGSDGSRWKLQVDETGEIHSVSNDEGNVRCLDWVRFDGKRGRIGNIHVPASRDCKFVWAYQYGLLEPITFQQALESIVPEGGVPAKQA